MVSTQKKNYIVADALKWKNTKFFWDDLVEDANHMVFHNKGFRQNQKAIINATKASEDVFGCMPTGGGKSLLFQLPALTDKEGVSIVIMPLVSLIQDQCYQLRKYGIEYLLLQASNGKQQQAEVREKFQKIFDRTQDAPKLIFVTPEKISKSEFIWQKFKEMYQMRLVN